MKFIKETIYKAKKGETQDINEVVKTFNNLK